MYARTDTPRVPIRPSEITPHRGAAKMATSSSVKPSVPDIDPRLDAGVWKTFVRRKESVLLRNTRSAIDERGRASKYATAWERQTEGEMGSRSR
jgi:hypothetical protein